MQTNVKTIATGLALALLGLGSTVDATSERQVGDIFRSADRTFTADFSGLPAGQRTAQLALGQGVSGGSVTDALLGLTSTLHVTGQRAEREGDSNRAMIFDGECAGNAESCSGGDDDLYEPGQGNLLIVSQDNDTADPNDNHEGGHIDFDFSGFGPGAVTVTSVAVFDVSHEGATIALYADGELIEEVPSKEVTRARRRRWSSARRVWICCG